jgi:alpha-beta hydrolase superfamily lysophospholipase
MRRLDDAAGWARWAERLHRWGVIDRLALRFVRYFTGDARRRHCLWNTWLSLGHFRVRRQWLKRFLRYHSLPMAVLASPEDPVIPFQTLAKRARRLPGLSLDEARGGHYQVLYNALHDWLGDRLRRP